MTQSSISTRLTTVGTNTFSRPSRNASRKRPVPPARPGPWTEDGIDAHEILADLARGGERGALALGLGPLVGRQIPAAMGRPLGRRSCPAARRSSPPRRCARAGATPARAAARTAATAPSTFIRSIGRGSSTHSVVDAGDVERERAALHAAREGVVVVALAADHGDAAGRQRPRRRVRAREPDHLVAPLEQAGRRAPCRSRPSRR